MELQSFYPIIVTPHLSECREFYRKWFEFAVVFEASWFVLLTSSANVNATLAFMHPDHPSAPPGPEGSPARGCAWSSRSWMHDSSTSASCAMGQCSRLGDSHYSNTVQAVSVRPHEFIQWKGGPRSLPPRSAKLAIVFLFRELICLG